VVLKSSGTKPLLVYIGSFIRGIEEEFFLLFNKSPKTRDRY
jgi:hypothetical protein